MNKENKKALLYIFGVTIFQSIIYYLVKIVQGKPNLIGSSLDSYIPFNEYFVYFYVIWYVMLIVVPYLFFKSDKQLLKKYLIVYTISAMIANIIFIIYPTTIDRAIFIPDTFTKNIVDIVYFFDVPVLNCLPSMHCVASFIFIFITLESKLKSNVKSIIISLSVMVILSTLFVKQHVIYDVLAAFIIVFLTNYIYKKFIVK